MSLSCKTPKKLPPTFGHSAFQLQVSDFVWQTRKRTTLTVGLANGAVMRTAITGVVQFFSIQDVIKNTLDVCQVCNLRLAFGFIPK